MGSKQLQTRQLQRDLVTKQMQDRLAMLKDKGLDDKSIAKDSKVKHLKARLKQIDAAVNRINQIVEQTQKLEERKAERIAREEAERLAERAGDRKAKAKQKVEEPKSQEKAKKAQKAKGAGAAQQKGEKKSK